MGHTPLVIPPVGFHTEIIFIRAVNEWSRIGEVGVDLELCVHAHGPDVHLLIEASFKINYSLDISSSYIWGMAFYNRGSDHVLL